MAKEIINRITSNKFTLLLSTILLVLLCFYGKYYYEIFSTGVYAPTRSDHVEYYNNARAFYETGSIQCLNLMDEYVAPGIQANVHGPMYPIFWGCINKIFGLHLLNMIYTNFVLFVLTIFIILRSKLLDLNFKLLLLIAELSFSQIFWQAFIYSPEMINIFLANLIGLELIRTYQLASQKDMELKDSWRLILVILISTAFRYSWSLAAVAFIPLIKHKKQALQFISLSAGIILLGLVYNKTCHAPYYGLIMTKVSEALKQGDISACIKMVSDNVINNLNMYFITYFFAPFYFVAKYLYFGSYCLVTYFAFKTKERLYIAASLIASMYYLSLLVFFDAYDFREIRGLLGAFILLLIVLAYRKHKYCLSSIALLSVLTLPNSLASFHYFGYDLFVLSAKIGPFVRNFEYLRQLPSEGRSTINILIPERVYWTLAPGREANIKNVLHTSALTLPYKNNEGTTIRYTENNNTVNPFKQWGRIRIDYVLNMQGEVIKNTEETRAIALKL